MPFSRIVLPAPIFLLIAIALFSSRSTFGSEADALAISQTIQQRHLPYGTILDPVFAAPDSNQVVNYTRCGDSAIWTGHYLAAEAFRYQVTRDPAALANVRAAIAGIRSLVDITGTDLLARCRFPTDSPYASSIIGEEQHNGIFTDALSGDSWVGNTSRDQYSGVFFGLAVAFDMVDEEAVRNSVVELITRMLDFLRNHAWTVIMPDGSISTTFIGRADQQLSFVTVGAHVNPGQYAGASELSNAVLSATVPAPIGLETTSNSSYFKFNLDAINLYNLIRLDHTAFHSIYSEAYNLLWKHVDDHQNAFFNMIDRGLEGPSTSRDAQTIDLLNGWLERPPRDVSVNLTGALPECGTAGEACDPVPVPERPSTDFLWQRDPFQLAGGGEGTTETAGIDYILPYWMGRYYGVIAPVAVVNAATGSASVSAESIASLYAPRLGTDPVQALSLPLPETLGGIRVQVTDSGGQSRTAPLFYTSPTQINFEIPPGTVPGRATVQALGTQGETLASTTVAVAAIAPGLFTVDADATAAATTIPGDGSLLYLSLYGTGIRNRSAVENVSVLLNGLNAPVLYAGPQGVYAGLDQVNIEIPASLRGAERVSIVLTVDGQFAPTVYSTLP